MKLMKLSKTIILALVVFSIVANLIAYSHLGSKVGMQMGTGGKLDNYVPKNIFIIIIPAALLLMYFLSKISDLKNAAKYTIASIVIAVINIVVIFANIK